MEPIGDQQTRHIQKLLCGSLLACGLRRGVTRLNTHRRNNDLLWDPINNDRIGGLDGGLDDRLEVMCVWPLPAGFSLFSRLCRELSAGLSGKQLVSSSAHTFDVRELIM